MAMAYGGKHQPMGIVLLGSNISRSNRLGDVRAPEGVVKGVYTLAIDRHGRTPEIHYVFEKDVERSSWRTPFRSTALAATRAGEASASSRSMPRLAGQSPRP
jgi:hypothetical protein